MTSATMPLLMQKAVMESIGIPLYKTVITALDRPNLYYNIAISDMSIQFDQERSPLDFILDEVNKNPDKELPKSIIYFNTVGILLKAVKRLRSLLPAHMKKYGDKLIQPYYADRYDADKDTVRALFARNVCRIICATEACGMGMNVPDVVGIFQVDPPINLAQVQQRFGRGGRIESLSAICTLILSKAFRGLNPDPEYVPPNQVQRGIKESKVDIWKWLVSPCLRRGFLEHLNVPDQYPDPPPAPGKCCSRCTERQLQSGIEITDPIIGFQGLCDLEIDTARLAKFKAIRKEQLKNRTHALLQEKCYEALLQWKQRQWKKSVKDGLVVPEMLVSNAILKTISMNLGGIVAGTNLSHVVQWGTREYFAKNNPDDPVENVVYDTWMKHKDEVEKLKADKKVADRAHRKGRRFGKKDETRAEGDVDSQASGDEEGEKVKSHRGREKNLDISHLRDVNSQAVESGGMMDEVTPLAHVASGNEAIEETTPDKALTITSRGRGRGRGSQIPRAKRSRGRGGN